MLKGAAVSAFMTSKVPTPPALPQNTARPLTLRERLYQRETLLTSKEVMALLGVTRDTLCDWVRAGKIAAYKLSDGYKFEPVVIADWLGARSTL